MKLNPSGGNDRVYTPNKLAKSITSYFTIYGEVVEPCCGNGSFLKYLPNADWYEIDKGKDFFECKEYYDWSITNPPFSKIRKFLQHHYQLGIKNIVFLCPLNHIIGLKARLNDMFSNGYSVREIILIDTPKEFPQSGFQWAVTHIKKGYVGDIKISYNFK